MKTAAQNSRGPRAVAAYEAVKRRRARVRRFVEEWTVGPSFAPRKLLNIEDVSKKVSVWQAGEARDPAWRGSSGWLARRR